MKSVGPFARYFLFVGAALVALLFLAHAHLDPAKPTVASDTSFEALRAAAHHGERVAGRDRRPLLPQTASSAPPVTIESGDAVTVASPVPIDDGAFREANASTQPTAKAAKKVVAKLKTSAPRREARRPTRSREVVAADARPARQPSFWPEMLPRLF